MKTLLKAVLPRLLLRTIWKVRQRYFVNYARDSYSQEGEDIVLERFLKGRTTGFYVDIGAHHPKRFSNTYRLYLRGWRGLNIDANPGSMKIFKKLRPRDINIEAAVSSKRETLVFYIFNEPAFNTLDRELAMERSARYTIEREVTVTTRRLSELLDEHVSPNIAIDLLTVDVEGLDYEVLRSNDWTRYRPEFIFVEALGTETIAAAKDDPITTLLSAERYSIVAKTMNSVLYRRDKEVC